MGESAANPSGQPAGSDLGPVEYVPTELPRRGFAPRPDIRRGDAAHADLVVDPDELRTAIDQIDKTITQLRGFDPGRLEIRPTQVGHTELGEALGQGTAQSRRKLAGLINDLEALADELRTDIDTLTTVEGDITRRFNPGSLTDGSLTGGYADPYTRWAGGGLDPRQR